MATKNGILYSGKLVYLYSKKIYPRYSSKDDTYSIKTGTYYLWDDKIINERIRITDKKDFCGQQGHIIGWINIVDILPIKNIKVGDKVSVLGYLYDKPAPTKNLYKVESSTVMYVVEILDYTVYPYYIGLSSNIYAEVSDCYGSYDSIEKIIVVTDE